MSCDFCSRKNNSLCDYCADFMGKSSLDGQHMTDHSPKGSMVLSASAHRICIASGEDVDINTVKMYDNSRAKEKVPDLLLC